MLAKRLPVVARLEGRVAPGYTVHGRIVVEPESVSVRGPPTCSMPTPRRPPR